MQQESKRRVNKFSHTKSLQVIKSKKVCQGKVLRTFNKPVATWILYYNVMILINATNCASGG